jgi:hypothetical protein
MAIAFDSAVDLGNNGGGASPLSAAFNNVAGDLVLACYNGDNIGGADDINSRTYNSVAMSFLQKITVAASGDRITYIDGLLGPATGSHTLSIGAASSHLIQGGAVSYSGVLQSGLPDNSTTNFSSPGATSLTTSITPSAANCWVVCVEGCYNSGAAPGAGTGATRRTFDATNGGWGIFDSGGPVTAGSPYSIQTTRSSNPFGLAIVHVVITIAPATGGGGTDQPIEKRHGGVPFMTAMQLRGGVRGGVW